MSPRERRRKLEAILEEHIVNEVVYQRRPWTCVVVRISFPDNCTFDEPGFSKVIWPDTWDADYGARLARKKAIAAMSRKLLMPGNEHLLPEDVAAQLE